MTTPHIAEAARVERVPGRVDHWLGAGLIALGAGLAVNSLLGPLAFGIVDYPLSETLRNQTLGLEAVSLLVVAPLSVVIGVLARRGHRAAPYVGVAIGAYTAYMLVQYIVGPSYLDYPRVLPLQLGLFVLGWVVALRAWIIGRSNEAVPPPVRSLPRAAGWFLLVTTAVTAMAATMLVNGDPYAAAVGQVIIFGLTELLVIAYVARLYRQIMR